jgi:hypothetical protein
MSSGTLALRAIRKPRSMNRTGVWRYVLMGDAWTVLASPIIYSTIVPLVLLDGWISAYQAICFRLWGIRRVRRRDYFAIDRHLLGYLNGVEKFNCFFCSYANGVFGYVHEIAARTEQYWCPIRHRRRVRHPHGRYASFVPYGDEARFRERLPALRAALRKK